MEGKDRGPLVINQHLDDREQVAALEAEDQSQHPQDTLISDQKMENANIITEQNVKQDDVIDEQHTKSKTTTKLRPPTKKDSPK